MTQQATNISTDRQPRLTAGDWTRAALTMLLDAGIEGVQITALARRLQVTRGSFYWHFDSRDDLLRALIDEWRARNTGFMVEAVANTPTLDDGILKLFAVWVDHTRFDPQLDQAVRDWARRDDALRHTLRAEDDARVAAIADFFARHGYDQPEAFIRARVIYFTQVSYYALGIDRDEALPRRLGYLDAYFRCFTGRDLDPAIAESHRADLTASGGK